MNNNELCTNAINTALYKFGKVEYRKDNTEYAPTWEWNVMLWCDGAWHSDCLGFVHCLVNGFIGNKSKLGGGAKMDSFVTNTDELSTINNYCKDVSLNFSSIVKGECLYMGGHVGLYVGDIIYNNKKYNVAENTMAFGGGAMLTYVDSKGNRFNHAGGTQCGKWEKHGKFKRVVYNEERKLTALDYIDIVKDTIQGKYGVNPNRQNNIDKKFGSGTYRKVQDIINYVYDRI